MRPPRSFLLLLLILVTLSGLTFLFPEQNLFPSPFTLISGPDSGKLTRTISLPDHDLRNDTILFLPSNKQNDSVSTASDRQLQAISGDSTLNKFLSSLNNAEKQVRIMYYGDSQIEGDRVTFLLRQLLREGRSGTGPGLLLPVIPVMYTKSVWLRSSSNWERYNYLSLKDSIISHNKLGPFLAFCRYLPENYISDVPEKASVRITPSRYADSSSSKYDLLRIFYSNHEGEVTINVYEGNKTIFTGFLERGENLKELSCQLKGAEDIRIEFEGNVSPDIYGISIESETGIVVDNIAQRGSAGLEFTMVDRENLGEAYRMLSPDLIILHYGLNIVRNIREDYSYYRRGLRRQLSLLKELAPSSAILVIGVTDMAEIKGDSISSYSNIPSIIRAQKEASLAEGVTFWDLFNAMGGKSSIIRWADRNPRLAQNDYVHFTYDGADTISRLLVSQVFNTDAKDDVINIMTDDFSENDTSLNDSAVKDIINTQDGTSADDRIVSAIFRYNPEKPFIFTTAAFWIFFLFVLGGYSLLYKKPFTRNLFLLAVSIYFYYKSGGLFLFLLILVTMIDYSCGLLIHHSEKKISKRLFVLVSIVTNLGILAYFKYSVFITGLINDLFKTGFRSYDFFAQFSNMHFGTSFDISTIILPVGISFFTFQSLSYTLDVYRSKLQPVRNILDFGFYVSFFPQLVAGPIVRASEFIPQLYSEFRLSKKEFSNALFLILKGLIKKIIISDFISTGFIDRVFDMPASFSGFENMMAVYGYGLQIYCDFSGYTDIAIGLGLILGFRLPVNFNSPYKASGLSDFWRRWHISLSRWLKDYLYISLGGNRKGRIRSILNLMITMLIGGLWHGADLKFILWGGLHGMGLVIGRISGSISDSWRLQNGFKKLLLVFVTFNFVNFCWIFFRAPDIGSALLMMKQIIYNFSPGTISGILPVYGNVFLMIFTGYLIHFLPEKYKESYRGLFINIPVSVQVAVAFALALFLYQARIKEIIPFIYFRF